MKWKSSQSAGDNAKAKLPALVRDYFQAGRKAIKAGKTAKQLHRFRVQTKQFRYALELFRPIYGPALDRHIKSLRGIQDALGQVSDYQAIRVMIADDKKLADRVQKAQEKKIKKFREEWKRFDSGGELKRWRAYLTRAQSPSGRAKRARKTPTRAASTTGTQPL
jgi:CHAD domain-containing protein